MFQSSDHIYDLLWSCSNRSMSFLYCVQTWSCYFILFFFFDAAKALYFTLQVEKEKRVSSVCSHLKWWSSPKRWVQTFPERISLILGSLHPGYCYVGYHSAELSQKYYLDGRNSNPMRNYVKIYSARKLEHILLWVCGVSDSNYLSIYRDGKRLCELNLSTIDLEKKIQNIPHF